MKAIFKLNGSSKMLKKSSLFAASEKCRSRCEILAPHLVAASIAMLASQSVMAQNFNNGLPAGWTVSGSAGTLGADGVVTASPNVNSTAYAWISTVGSSATAGYDLGGETSGSVLTSNNFTAKAGNTLLNFYFNYVTSDGAGFSDYAYANLLNGTTGDRVAVLFTARTQENGTISPGIGLPPPTATLTPTSVPIIGGAPQWSPLGEFSERCYGSGCGYTGWIQSTYQIPDAGTYRLEFGVTNVVDGDFASGLAIDGVTIAGRSIDPGVISAVPEPSGMAMMLGGMALMGSIARRRMGRKRPGR